MPRISVSMHVTPTRPGVGMTTKDNCEKRFLDGRRRERVSFVRKFQC
jgi:hypothetical protein